MWKRYSDISSAGTDLTVLIGNMAIIIFCRSMCFAGSSFHFKNNFGSHTHGTPETTGQNARRKPHNIQQKTKQKLWTIKQKH